MGVGPIPNFGAFPAIQPQVDSPELPAVYRVENSARPNGYSANRKPSTARQESEIAAPVEASPEESASSAPEAGADGSISIFA